MIQVLARYYCPLRNCRSPVTVPFPKYGDVLKLICVNGHKWTMNTTFYEDEYDD